MENTLKLRKLSSSKDRGSVPSLNDKIIRLGVCAMEKKINSKQMKNILKGLKNFNEFKIIIFTEEIIFKQEVEAWPIVDALIIFFSLGFPYSKGLLYINLRSPFLINDFEMQKILWDRRKVLEMLNEENILTPKKIIINRGEEINNEDKMANKLNDSAEIEKMIKEFQTEQENSKKIISKDDDNKYKGNYFRSYLNIDSLEHRKLKLTQNEMSLVNNNNKSPRRRSSSFCSEQNCLKNHIIDDVGLREYDDHIKYKGEKMYKPFVEKPCNSDDHNIYIYYHPSHGGGQKRLFRKTKDLCSLYIPNENSIRRDKSYIYEEFLQTDGFDIKVYTVGPEYYHAEARKSPSLDGIVKRSKEGKEVRYPVNLTQEEKEFARKIVKLFKQNVCGFDILRAKGKSYVCDVNGWSFVKGNKKYFEDCVILLRKMILLKIDRERYLTKKIYIKKNLIYTNLNLNNITDDNKEQKNIPEELRSIVAVFRHADRSPKQKMKLVVNHPEILSLFDKFGDREKIQYNNKDAPPKFKEIKLKKPKELMEVLQIVTHILSSNKINEQCLSDVNDNFFTKLFQIKMVLEKNLNFEGMTRKIQMKPLKIDSTLISSSNKGFNNINVKRKKYYVSEALMIIKWGGNLTHAGIDQAKLLGNIFRYEIYPSNYQDGSGLLRLHATYRHDLKCYSSDEGRCLKTAAAFLQGLLQYDGPVIPIITSMVRKDDPICQDLDISSEPIPEIKVKIKQELSECLNTSGKLIDKFNTLFDRNKIYPLSKTNDNRKLPLYGLMVSINNPYERMKIILTLMDSVIEHIKSFLSPEEVEVECNSYFIKSVTSIQKRTILKTTKKLTEEAMNYLDHCDEDIDYNGIPSPRWTNRKSQHSTSSRDSTNYYNNNESKPKKISFEVLNNKSNPQLSSDQINSQMRSIPSQISEKKEKEKTMSESSSFNQTNGQKTFKDCEDEKIILIFKRYIKLRKDFYNTKTNKFDISKIPDIYDNIKYDIIHNRNLLNDDAYTCFQHITLLANFVMSLEYGITVQEKINIGIKVIGPLLSKIQKDLLWWNTDNVKQNQPEPSEVSFSGLDQSRVEDIKSSWRKVKTRFYFTCSSHIYSLMNLLSYGYDSFLLDVSQSNKKGVEELRKAFDLDYCSHIVFRLYENFNVEAKDPKRFRFEIIMSPGSTKDPTETDINHMISISPWIVLNNNLTLEQMKEFFGKLLSL